MQTCKHGLVASTCAAGRTLYLEAYVSKLPTDCQQGLPVAASKGTLEMHQVCPCFPSLMLAALCCLQAALGPVLLRRMKEDVETLPEKEEVVIWVELTSQQRAYYK